MSARPRQPVGNAAPEQSQPQSESENLHIPWWRRPFSGDLWQNHDFLRLWASQTVSASGSQITTLALPLAAVITLHASAGEMGILRAVQVLPALLFGLFAGALVDRVRRRPVLIWTDLGRALTLGLIPLAAGFNWLSMSLLFVVGFVAGTLRLCFDVAYFSFLPSLVKRTQLVEGNSKLELTSSAAQIAGPTLGGLLIQLLTAPFAITVDALSFIASALFVRRIRTREAAPTPREQRQGLLVEIRAGLRFVLGTPTLRALAASTATFNLGLGIIFALYILFLSRSLGLSPAIIGVVSAFTGPGYVIGALLAGRLAARFGIGPAIIAGHLLGGAALLAIPAAAGPWFVVVPILAGANLLNGVTGEIAMINHLSLRQQLTPDVLLGRTNATMRVISWSAAPLAALVGGAVGEAAGVRLGLALGAVVTLLSVFWLLFSPVRHLRGPIGA